MTAITATARGRCNKTAERTVQRQAAREWRTTMERSLIGGLRSPKPAHPVLKARMQCPDCKERFVPGKSACYCNELNRRRVYDEERARKGLAALYRPPSMR